MNFWIKKKKVRKTRMILTQKKVTKIMEKKKGNHQLPHVSFSIRMDVGHHHDYNRHLEKQRNHDFFNTKKHRYHPFFPNPSINSNKKISQKRLEQYSYNTYESNENDNKKICIYKRGEPCESHEKFMEVNYNALLPTKGREIAANDRDGTYHLQICKYYQKGHCFDGRCCFFAHLDL